MNSKTIETMKEAEWVWNGTNGDTDGGLFISWGLGVHRLLAHPHKDVIFENSVMYGHAGDAYGLISDMYHEAENQYAVIVIANGYKPGNAYKSGVNSSFLLHEENAFSVMNQYSRPACLNKKVEFLE